jgi:hypothetical protein
LPAVVLSLAVHWKLAGLANEGLNPLTVACPRVSVTLPKTICPPVAALAEQVLVVPQFCSLGWLLKVRLATGVVDEITNGGVPGGTVEVIREFVVIGSLKLFKVEVSRSSQFFPSPTLPM